MVDLCRTPCPFLPRGKTKGVSLLRSYLMERGCFSQPSRQDLPGVGQEALPVFGNASLLSSGASKLMDLSFVRSFINPGFQVIIDWLNRLDLCPSYWRRLRTTLFNAFA